MLTTALQTVEDSKRSGWLGKGGYTGGDPFKHWITAGLLVRRYGAPLGAELGPRSSRSRSSSREHGATGSDRLGQHERLLHCPDQPVPINNAMAPLHRGLPRAHLGVRTAHRRMAGRSERIGIAVGSAMPTMILTQVQAAIE